MVVLLYALIVLAAVLLLMRQRRRRLRAGGGGQPLRDRTLFDLQPGDIVQAGDGDWAVEDVLTYDQQGFEWLEYLLIDGQRRRWLVVCEDDALEVSWLETVHPDPLPTWPLPSRIHWQGVEYERCEQGSAAVTASERRINNRMGRCRFHDYRGPDDRELAIEVWGDPPESMELEITAGRRIDPRSLTLLPGDGRRIHAADA